MARKGHFESSPDDDGNGMEPFDLEDLDLDISDESHRPFASIRGMTQKDTAFPSSYHFMMNLRIACERTFLGTGSYNNTWGLRRRSIVKLIFYALIVCLCTIGILSVCENAADALSSPYPPGSLRWSLLHWGQMGDPTENLVHWPTDATADTTPIQCHSHNDYWRQVPFYSAVAVGCRSVEADIWLVDDELYVGHRRMSLTDGRTLRNLYLDPLISLLEAQNVHPKLRPDEDYPIDPGEILPVNGVFDSDPTMSLVLLLDFKSTGPATWWRLQSQLAPLREKNYLTYFNGTGVVEGPITIVVSGHAPFDHLTANETYRDIFYDAPLEDLADQSEMWPNPNIAQDPSRRSGEPQHAPRQPISTRVKPVDNAYDRSNSFYASASFTASVGRVWGSRLTQAQLQRIRGQVRGAHKHGLKVRYWGVPSWPVGLRNHLWHILVREGADVLSIDDLHGAAYSDWRRARRRDAEWPRI